MNKSFSEDVSVKEISLSVFKKEVAQEETQANTLRTKSSVKANEKTTPNNNLIRVKEEDEEEIVQVTFYQEKTTDNNKN